MTGKGKERDGREGLTYYKYFHSERSSTYSFTSIPHNVPADVACGRKESESKRRRARVRERKSDGMKGEGTRETTHYRDKSTCVQGLPSLGIAGSE